MTEEKRTEKGKEPTVSLAPEEDDMPRKTAKFDVQAILINAVVALLVLVSMNSFIMPVTTKSIHISDITRLENDLVGMRTVESGLQEKINTTGNTLTSVISEINESIRNVNSNITSAISKLEEGINSLSSDNAKNKLDIEILSKTIVDRIEDVKSSDKVQDEKIDSNYEALLEKIKAQEARIVKLETQPVAPVVVGSGITIVATSLQSNPLFSSNTTNYYSLAITNSNNVWKKVRLQIVGSPWSGISGSPLINVTSSIFTASGGFSPDGTFTTTITPAINTTGMVGISNGYLIVSPGTTQVIITLSYTASGTYGWELAFSPIVIP